MDVLWIVLSGVAGLAIGSGCMVGLSKAGLNTVSYTHLTLPTT